MYIYEYMRLVGANVCEKEEMTSVGNENERLYRGKIRLI